MKAIKNKNFLKNIIAIVIMLCVIAGITLSFISYFKEYKDNMDSQLEKVIADKDSAIALLNDTISDFEVELENTRTELAKVTLELEQARENTEKQNIEIEQYKQIIEDEEAKWQRRYEEYPVATEAWIAMKTLGWSDTACAGIMGNFMAETGGTGTLHLDWDSNGENGYGLVQWIGGRRNTIKNKYGTYPSVKEQVQFIHDELYGVNGVRRQVTDSQLNKIMNAETPEECAYAFACYYERCATEYRSMRRGFARKAYDYFTV